MEARNLRKERTGVVLSNKMDKTITVAASARRRNTMLMMKRMSAMSAILYESWKLVL